MFVPNKKQFKKWSLPSKYSAIGIPLGIIGIVLTIYFGSWPQQTNGIETADLKTMADFMSSKILEGSPLCCNIKTAEIVAFLPQGKEIRINARSFIGLIPTETDESGLSFSFTENQQDSFKTFDCKMIGRTNLNIYFLRNSELFCSKPATLDLRDPSSFCTLPESNNFEFGREKLKKLWLK